MCFSVKKSLSIKMSQKYGPSRVYPPPIHKNRLPVWTAGCSGYCHSINASGRVTENAVSWIPAGPISLLYRGDERPVKIMRLDYVL